jgi:DNA-binding transcriptional LysR family regulator
VFEELHFGRAAAARQAGGAEYPLGFGCVPYLGVDLVDVSSTNLRALVIEVARGNGIAFAQAWAAEGTGERSAVVVGPIDPPGRQFDLAVAWRRDPPNELRPVVEAVREVARRLRVGQDQNLGGIAARSIQH